MQSIGRTFHSHVPLYFCTILFSLLAAALLDFYGVKPKFGAVFFFLSIFLAVVTIVGIIAIACEIGILAKDGFPNSPLQRIARGLQTRLCKGDRIGNIFHSILSFSPVLVIYAAFKGSITLIHPFSWDLALSHFDEAIGFGTQPWKILQPFLGVPAITIALSYLYYVWFLALYGCIVWQAFSSRDDALRTQFLIALSFAFFLAGCLLATIFSSAGPCYFSYLDLGPDPYADQLAYLHSIGSALPSVIVQNDLWRAFASGAHEHGVSAMPSMHVTVAVLLGLLGWRRGGWLAPVLPVFALLIVLASVHLAWHYASDSIAGIGLAIAFWYSAGRVVDTWNGYLMQHTGRKWAPMKTAPAAMENASSLKT